MNASNYVLIVADSLGMYEGMTTAFGPTTNKSAPLKSSHGELGYHRVWFANEEVGWIANRLGDTIIILSPFRLVISNSTLL